MTRILKAMVGSAIVVACVACAAWLAAPGSSAEQANDQGAAVVAFPSDARTQADRSYRDFHAQAQRSAPAPFLAEPEQRRLWIESYRRMRKCFEEHGYFGAPDVADTWGDGKTPIPMTDGNAPNAAKAMASCELDLRGVDTAALRKAMTADVPPPPKDGGG